MIRHIAISKFVFCSLLAVILGSADPVRGGDAKPDQDKLQGTWQATEGVSDGKPVPKDQIDRTKLVFAGEKMILFPPDGDGKNSVENTFRLDPSKKPKFIDATPMDGGGKGKTARGIYELDGDTLKLCLSVRLEKDRPTEFAAREKSGLVILTFKRVKK